MQQYTVILKRFVHAFVFDLSVGFDQVCLSLEVLAHRMVVLV